ncbi:MAG: response regulator [Fuerstiella sp.]
MHNSNNNSNWVVWLVEDDLDVQESIVDMVHSMGVNVEAFASAEEFLAGFDSHRKGCLVTDMRMAGISGLELIQTLRRNGHLLPVILVSGHANVEMTVQAMNSGAMTVLPKPFSMEELSDVIGNARKRDVRVRLDQAHSSDARVRLSRLTVSEFQVLNLIAQGQSNKAVARDLDVSLRTVEDRRRRVYNKLGVASLAGVMEIAIGRKYSTDTIRDPS